MEQVTIWYATDNKPGHAMAEAIRGLGLSLNLLTGLDLENANLIENGINIFVVDLTGLKPATIMDRITKNFKLQGFLKFVILKKKEIQEVQKKSYNALHLEFVNRPADRREFLLLLEKSIIVERYREIMKIVSREAEGRIELFEGLMDVNRKNVFESDREKLAFENIMNFEKHLVQEQNKLVKTINRFTVLRQSEMFDTKKRMRIEEMIEELRRRELLDAHKVIEAQESVINYSAKELDDAKQIISATENVAELSRSESLQVRSNLDRERHMNRELSAEIERLLQELAVLRDSGAKPQKG